MGSNFVVETDGNDNQKAHVDMAHAVDSAIEKIKAIQTKARQNNDDSILPLLANDYFPCT